MSPHPLSKGSQAPEDHTFSSYEPTPLAPIRTPYRPSSHGSSYHDRRVPETTTRYNKPPAPEHTTEQRYESTPRYSSTPSRGNPHALHNPPVFEVQEEDDGHKLIYDAGYKTGPPGKTVPAGHYEPEEHVYHDYDKKYGAPPGHYKSHDEATSGVEYHAGGPQQGKPVYFTDVEQRPHPQHSDRYYERDRNQPRRTIEDSLTYHHQEEVPTGHQGYTEEIDHHPYQDPNLQNHQPYHSYHQIPDEVYPVVDQKAKKPSYYHHNGYPPPAEKKPPAAKERYLPKKPAPPASHYVHHGEEEAALEHPYFPKPPEVFDPLHGAQKYAKYDGADKAHYNAHEEVYPKYGPPYEPPADHPPGYEEHPYQPEKQSYRKPPPPYKKEPKYPSQSTPYHHQPPKPKKSAYYEHPIQPAAYPGQPPVRGHHSQVDDPTVPKYPVYTGPIEDTTFQYKYKPDPYGKPQKKAPIHFGDYRRPPSPAAPSERAPPARSQYQNHYGQPPAKEEKIIYLTFDDGPNQGTSGVLDVLDEHKVRGTFFINSINLGQSWSNSDASLVRTAKAGHMIADHSEDHMKHNGGGNSNSYLDIEVDAR